MTTERRDTPRIPVSLDTIVRYNNRNYRHATIDISLDGAFVRAGGARLPRRGALELAIKLPADGAQRYHRFHAQVVRATARGIGLAFERVDTEGYAALLALLFASERAATAR